ncbi:MAG: type III polyketide synthase [Verrucomicrobiales bacterium]
MYLESIASSLPRYVFTQSECLAALAETGLMEDLTPRSRLLLGKVLGGAQTAIEQRHFCLPEIGPVVGKGAQELNEYFEQAAPDLATRALAKALAQAGVDASELDALLVCTCTGYLCPGITSHVAERLDLPAHAYLQDLVGLGCGAAIPMLRAAHGLLAADPVATVATVAVEVCSAAFYADDDPGVLISLCLFGDGASAAIWSGEAGEGKWRAGEFTTVHRPEQREKIRFVNAGGRLKNQLDKAVPRLAAEAVAELFAQRSEDPDRVLAHSGGRDVIEALEAVLPFGLSETREVLASCGNMSSPSVMFALEKALASAREDRRWWLTAFGAGFAAHACELWR